MTNSTIFNHDHLLNNSVELLIPIESLIRDQLLNWFGKEDYLTSLAIPFSANVDTTKWTENAETLQQSILNGSYNIRLEIRSNNELGGALGAYSATGTTGKPTIYLNGDWLQTASFQEIQAVLLEELGHDFDNYINNGADSQGDEGEIFANLILNKPFNIKTLQEQNDHQLLTIDNVAIAVENAVWGPANIAQTFFIPIKESDERTSLAAVGGSGVGTTLTTIISTVVTSNGTIIVYDHWEDGYETDINFPTQATTQIWGDGNLTNGSAPGDVDDLLTAGQVITLKNDVVLANVGGLNSNGTNKPYYDGRDKIGATKAIAITRAGWAINPGTVLAGAVNVYDVGNAGISYTIPIGQNVITSNPDSAANRLFEYTSLHIVATENNTRVKIDRDGNGSVDITVTLNQGETYLVSGGVLAGATVNSEDSLGTTTKRPITVYSIAGDVGSSYENRWFAITPKEQWSNSYYAPVGTTLAIDPVFVFLYNPSTTSPITVYYDTQGTSGSSIVVPANTTKYVQMPNSGAHFYTTDGAKFFAVSTIDSDATNNQTHDWSYSLVPESYLTDRFVVAWGPGNNNADPKTALNGSPVWVTAPKATTLYIDLDGDGWILDGLGKPDYTQSNARNVKYNIQALESYRITDSLDFDQSGISVFTIDGTLITGAWGEDPAVAGPGNPYLDMGTTVLPFPDYVFKKTSKEASQATYGTGVSNDNNLINLNEQVEYTISVTNRAVIDLFNINIKDSINPTDSAIYVPNSANLTIYNPDGTILLSNTDLDGLTNLFPLDQATGGYTITDTDTTLAGNQGLLRGYQAVIKYRVTVRGDVNKNLTDANLTITNSAKLTGDPSGGGDAITKDVNNNTPVSVPNVDGEVSFRDSSYGSSVTSYQENGIIYLQVVDGDLNTYRDLKDNSNDNVLNTLDTLTVTVTNTTTGELETVTLTETTFSSGIFRAPLPTSTNNTNNGNNSGILYMVGGHSLKVDYIDPIFGAVFDNPSFPGIPNGDDNNINTGLANTATGTVVVPSKTKILYLSDDGASGDSSGDLDRIDPTKAPHTTDNPDIDSTVNLSAVSTKTYRDSFGTVSYSGSSGTQAWTSDWTDQIASPGTGGVNDSNAAANGGSIQVVNSGNSSGGSGNSLLITADTTSSPAAVSNRGASRAADLNGATSATLSFFYNKASVNGTNPTLAVEVYNGSSWSLLDTLDSGDANGNKSYSIPAGALNANFRIRFRVASTGSQGNENFFIDDIQVQGTFSATPTTTFTQSIPMADTFIIPNGGTINVVTYISGLSGGTPSNQVTAALTYGASGTGNTVVPLTFQSYTSLTGTTGYITWTGTPSSGNVTIPAGQKVQLLVTNNQSGLSFKADYDSATTPSRIELPTTTVIDIVDVDSDGSNGVQNIGFYNSAFSNDANTSNDGSFIPSIDAGGTVYLRVKVSDPFGDYDITSLNLTIDGPGTTGDLNLSLDNTYVVDTNNNGAFKIYEYPWKTVLNTGTYSVTVKANEGYEGNIFDTATSTFDITALDLGTPSVTQFITGLLGADAGTQYAVGANAFLRVTDLDENQNDTTIETIQSVVNGVTFTLTETGVNTGIFEAALTNANSGNTGQFISLTAGTVLTASYVDNDDATDTSGDTISVPSAGNIPPTLDLDTTNNGTVNNTATFNEGDTGVAFTKDATGTPITDDTDTIAFLRITIPLAQITNGASEQLLINGATSGGTIALNTNNTYTITGVGGVTYTLNVTDNGTIRTLNFAKNSGNLTKAETEAILEALRYNNTSENPTDANRVFTAIVNDGTLDSNTATFTVDVNPVNDPPVLDLDGGTLGFNYTTTFIENSSTNVAIADTDDLITDLDSTIITNARIVLTNPLDGALESLSINGTLPLGITASGYNSATGVLTLTGSATLANYQTALSQVVYNNTSANLNSTPRTVDVTVSDGENDSNIATTTINITPVNNPPTLDLDGNNSSGATGANYNTTFTEQTPIAIGDVDVVITDVDDTNIESATITLTNRPDGNGVESLIVNGTLPTGITASSYDSSTGVLTLTGSATLANYQTAIAQIQYNNTSDNPNTTPRSVTVTVNDGNADSNLATTTINITPVNDPPTLDLDGNNSSGATGANYNTTFTEQTPIAIGDLDVTITDVDDTNIESATITLTNRPDGNGVESLIVNGTLPTGITASSYNSTTGVLTLTGSATLANYQTAIAQIQYNNTSDNPNTTPRSVTVIVNDGNADSNLATTTINITPVNDPPTLDLDGNNSSGATSADYNTTFAGVGAVAIGDVDVVITDVDDTNIESATITLTNRPDGNGVESLIVNGTLPTGITASSYNSATGVLTLTGNATLANYQTAIAQIQYNNSSSNPSTTPRSVTVIVNDGNADSNLATTTISIAIINDPPALDLDGNDSSLATGADYNTTFTEGTPIAIGDVDVTITDADDTNIESATITLTNRPDGNGVESLIVNGTLPAGITASSYNSSTGVLTLSGSATLANYQTAIAQIQYNNSSNNPNTTPRSVTVIVNDGNANSNLAITTINITPVNDPPTLDLDGNDSSGATGANYNTTFTEQTPIAIGDVDVTITDVDDTNIESATITLTNRPDGNGVESLIINGTLPAGITASSYNSSTGVLTLTGSASLANYQTAIAQIQYNNTSNNPNTTPRSVTVIVNDGNADSNLATTTINITPVNDPPSGTNKTVTITEDSSYTFNVLDFGFSDTEGNSFSAVKITTLPTAGTLELNGSAINSGDLITVANIPNLVFTPILDGNSIGSAYANFTFQVQDNGGISSGGINLDPTPKTFSINVTPVNDAPVANPNVTIPPVNQDNINPPLNPLPTLLNSSYDDSKDQVLGGSSSTPLRGIAIVGNNADPAQGKWQYSASTLAYELWNDIPTSGLSTSSALVLNNYSTVKLRFLPNPQFNGTPTNQDLEVYLSDGLGFSASSTVSDRKDISGDIINPISGWSNDSILISTTINKINTPPIINDLDGDIFAVAPNGTTKIDQVTGTDILAATITDVQGLKIGGQLTISLDGFGVSTNNDTLSINPSFLSGIGTIDAVNDGTNGKPLTINFTKDLTPAEGNTLIQNITYQASNTVGIRAASFTVTDGQGGTSNTATAYLNVTSSTIPYGPPILGDLNGQVRSDILKGTSGNDIINGKGSNDILYGYNGDDLMMGGDANDRLDAAAGNDILIAGNGDDALLGGDGQDILLGGDGADNLTGGNGNDYLNGGFGTDTLTGGTGADMFDYSELNHSFLGIVSSVREYDLIMDFNVSQGDKILTSRLINSFNTTPTTITSLTHTAVASALISLGADSAALVKFGTRTFLAINDSETGFDANNDTFVEFRYTATTTAPLNTSIFSTL